MPADFIKVDLDEAQKEAILKYAGFFLQDKQTKDDLTNKTKQSVRFNPHVLQQVIGELAYHFNRTKSDTTFYFLDDLIGHLENYERR